MTDSDRPLQAEFKSRVRVAMEALDGYPGAPRTLGQLAEDAGVTPSNLASALALRRTMTWGGLRRLHRALKLDALGLELAVWDEAAEDPAILGQRIGACRRGDPVELALAHSRREAFLAIRSAGAFMGVRPVRAAGGPRRPGLAVFPGQSLRIGLTPPLDGFVKIICREGAEFFSLDGRLKLLRRRFRAGEPVELETEIDVEPGYFGETVFVALASAEPFGSDWPRGYGPGEVASRETCADLFRSLFGSPAESWRATVFSIWTLPETTTRLG